MMVQNRSAIDCGESGGGVIWTMAMCYTPPISVLPLPPFILGPALGSLVSGVVFCANMRLAVTTRSLVLRDCIASRTIFGSSVASAVLVLSLTNSSIVALKISFVAAMSGKLLDALTGPKLIL